MKKIAYLCIMTMLSMNVMAQFDLNDQNWDTVFIEDFSGIRSWNSNWKDTRNIQNYSSLWRCYANEYWPCCSTTALNVHQAYQPSNAVFGTDQTMKLIGEFKSQDTMWCDVDYLPAPPPHHCDSVSAQHPSIHYYSGMIETINLVGFGFYEIECKMPIHPGACSSFWLWSCKGGTYNEIDIFEHSKKLSKYDISKETVSGIWFNPDSTNCSYDPVSGYGAHRYASKHNILPDPYASLEDYHKYSCLWLPDRVAFYVDSTLISECTDPEQIPQFPMWLKIMHAEDDDALIINGTDSLWWEGSDEMTVNYVKAFRLDTDCEEDVYIRDTVVFKQYHYSVKHSITMGGRREPLVIPNNKTFTMRAVESINIDGELEVPVGTEMTLITQACPQWPSVNKDESYQDPGITGYSKTFKKTKR